MKRSEGQQVEVYSIPFTKLVNTCSRFLACIDLVRQMTAILRHESMVGYAVHCPAVVIDAMWSAGGDSSAKILYV